MGVCPNCGSWVDDGDVCMNCGGSGSYSHDDDSGEAISASTNSKRDRLLKKAWDLYMDFNDLDALKYVNKALDLDSKHPRSWNIKGIILESLERYEESEECYNRSLELSKSNLVYDNKARMLYVWASRLFEESKNLPDGRDKLDEAERTIVRAIRALSGDSDEDIEDYLMLRDNIISSSEYESIFQLNLEIMSDYDKSELFTIAGRKFYKNNVVLTRGLPLRLLREPDNEFDGDAIGVYAGDEKIGYVANSESTKYEATSSASQLKDTFEDVAQAEYLLYLDRYAEIQFHIGRIIK